MAKRAILLWLVLSGADLAHAVFVARVASQPCVPREDCAQVCATGQACGNVCVAEGVACEQAEGQACDSTNVCR